MQMVESGDFDTHECGIDSCQYKVKRGSKWFCEKNNVVLGSVDSGNQEAAPCKRAASVSQKQCKHASPKTEFDLLLFDMYGSETTNLLTLEQINFFSDKIDEIHAWAGRPAANLRAFAFACLTLIRDGVHGLYLKVEQNKDMQKLNPQIKNAVAQNIRPKDVTKIVTQLRQRKINRLSI